MTLTAEEDKLLVDAAFAIQELCLFKYEAFTANSCTNRQHWTREQECRYGDEIAYELSLKLLAMSQKEDD